MSQTILSLKNVSIYQENNLILSDINLEVQKGEFLYFIGKTGSGKSSIMKVLYADLPLKEGEGTIVDYDLNTLKEKDIPYLRRKIGIVFQDFKLLPKLNVFENVAFALEMYGNPMSEVRNKTLKALELVGLKNKAKQYPDKLSGGEQQRVAIARAIVNGPKLLLCDEPTGNLDPDTSYEILKVLEVINNLGTTVIMATHDREMVNKFKKRVIVLDNGKLVKDYEKGSYVDAEDV